MHRRLDRTRGLTLIELIVVMAILVILAGLTLPKLDVFKLKANKAQAASNMESVTNYVTAFKVQRDIFPDNWDSLLDTTGATLFTELNGELPGGKLAVTTIANADELRSLNRVGIGNVLDHTAGLEIPGNSGDNPRVLASGQNVATIDGTTADGQAIIGAFYPTNGTPTVPANKKLAVFGLGPRNSIIGDMIHTAPFYPNLNQLTEYNRFLVVFEFDTGGSRARLLGSIGADGDLQEAEIQEFYTN